MSDNLVPLTTDSFQSNKVYQTESYEKPFDNDHTRTHIRFGVLGDGVRGFEFHSRYYENRKLVRSDDIVNLDADTANRLFNNVLIHLPDYTTVMEVGTKPAKNEPHQGERNVSEKPALEKSTVDNVKEGSQNPATSNKDRPNNAKPRTEDAKEEYTGGSFLEDVEHWIPSLFLPGQQGIASLKSDLLENTQDGGNPLLGALAASGLDLLDTAMGMTQGIPLGILDIRNLGEGTEEALIALEEGGDASDVLRGLKKDASRALTIAGYIIPEGAVIKASNRALAGADIVDSLSQGDFKSTATQLAMAALHEKAKSKLNNKKGKSNGNDKGNDSMQSGSQERWLSRTITGNKKLLVLKDEILNALSNDSTKVPLPRGIKLKLEELGILSSHLGVELAVVSKRTNLGRERFIIVGEVNSVNVGYFLRGGNTNRVVAHTHPGLKIDPSEADIFILDSRAQIYAEQSNHGVRAGQTSSVIIDEFGNTQKFRAQFVDVNLNTR